MLQPILDTSKMSKIPFSKTTVIGTEIQYLSEAINADNGLKEDGKFSLLCKQALSSITTSQEIILTGSCTQALEIIAIMIEFQLGDEIIIPSYTFVSAVNAFVIHGGTPVFVDINPHTMNMDETLLEAAITPKTKAIMVMHYGGVSCNMEFILAIAKKYDLLVIEDAAQALSAKYRDRPLGSFGDFSVFSFHNTKNYTCGEGGALAINNNNYIQRAHIIRDKGTNRSQFQSGKIDKYLWVDVGASYILSELNASFLYAQLLDIERINEDRMGNWKAYENGLKILRDNHLIDVQDIPQECSHNAHLYYIKLKDSNERKDLIEFLKTSGIDASFHYSALHSTEPGKKYCRFSGADNHTTKESERLLRLPIFYGMSSDQTSRVITSIKEFFKKTVLFIPNSYQ
jgi:dTDP-4-amino-4,6-dideoxygalactose transaminase